jgi:hypothetical protein
MDTKPDSQPEINLVEQLHVSKPSRKKPFLHALVIASLYFGLIYLAWHNRNIAVFVSVLFLIYWGIKNTYSILPLHQRTRNRLRKEYEIAASYRYFNILVCIFSSQFGSILYKGISKGFDPSGFIISGTYILIGALWYLYWRVLIQPFKCLEMKQPTSTTP